MAARDGTGPMGQGSNTGRGLGNCPDTEETVAPQNNVAASGKSFGVGRGAGTGRGLGNGRSTGGRGLGGGIRAGCRQGQGRFFGVDPVNDKDALQMQAEHLESQLNYVKKQIYKKEEL